MKGTKLCTNGQQTTLVRDDCAKKALELGLSTYTVASGFCFDSKAPVYAKLVAALSCPNLFRTPYGFLWARHDNHVLDWPQFDTTCQTSCKQISLANKSVNKPANHSW
jgi:hypothetical protein